MTEIKRYSFVSEEEDPEGEWVLYSDHARAIEAAEADARRYRWILSHTRNEADDFGAEWGWHNVPDARFTEAIDAAMSQESPRQPETKDPT